MTELNRLPISVQLKLIEAFGNLREHDLNSTTEELGRIARRGITLFRLRHDDHRIYFERRGDELFSHFILHRHTLADFIVRMKLPYDEESLLEQDQSFIKYLEAIARRETADK